MAEILNFFEMIRISSLYKTNMLSLICWLTQQFTGRHAASLRRTILTQSSLHEPKCSLNE